MRNRLLIIISIAGIGMMMGGCSLLEPGPPRDSDGRVGESTVMSARDLAKGDCFSMNSTGDVIGEVTVMPCTDTHDYIIIGQGVLAPNTVAAAGSLQNAVSVACTRDFNAFKAAVKGETKPKQEFMTFPETKEPKSNQLYSCISTDPDQNFIALKPTPEPESTTEP